MMNAQITTQPALIVIDVQKGFEDPKWGKRNNPQAEVNIMRMLHAWRAARLPVFHVKHNSQSLDSPLRPGTIGNEIRDDVAPIAGEPVFDKTVNSAFIGTRLEVLLREQKVRDLVVVGLTTPHCVSTSVRMAGNLGFTVSVIEDATAAFELSSHDGKRIAAADVHYHALAALSGEFATIKSTQACLVAIGEYKPLGQRHIAPK